MVKRDVACLVAAVACGLAAALSMDGLSTTSDYGGSVPLPAQGDGSVVFEENLGQSDDSVRYLARGGAYSVFLQQQGVTVARRGDDAVATRFDGAGAAEVSGEAALPGVVHVFRGADPERWVQGARRFARVRYGELYPGVDLVCYGDEGRVQYDFEVAPGVDPDVVRLRFGTDAQVALDERGNLVVREDADTSVVHEAPFVYQRDGDRAEPVAAAFELHDDGSVGFALADHDPGRTLVIDPTLDYQSFLGGTDGDEAHGIWVAPDGSRYVAGRTISPDFPGTQSAAQDYDLFVSKLAPDGSTLEFTTLVGSPAEEFSAGLVVDPRTGEIVLAGQSTAGGYPTQNAYQSAFRGIGPPESDQFQFGDAVLTKLSPDGSSIVFSTYLGGEWGELCHDVALGPDGSIALCGRTDSADFPTFQPLFGRSGDLPSGNADAWAAKFDASGKPIFATYMGGSFPNPPGNTFLSLEHFTGVAMDAKGHVWLCGWSNSDDFPTTIRVPLSPGFVDVPGFSLTIPDGRTLRPNRPNWDDGVGRHDAVLVQIHKKGKKLLYSRFFGGRDQDYATDIALDARGNPHVTGSTRSGDTADFPLTPNGFQLVPGETGGDADAFLTIFHKKGKKLLYGSLLGGERPENSTTEGRIAIDQFGRVHLTGRASSEFTVTFPLTEDALDTEARSFEAFLTTFTPLGVDGVQYSSLLGARFTDVANGIAIDARGRVHLAGVTLSPDLAPTPDAVQSGYSGSGEGGTGDAFIATLDIDVEAAAQGRAKSKKRVNFGKRKVGQTRTKRLVIKNVDRKGPAVLVEVGEPDAPFRLVSGGGTHLIPPGARHVVELEFAPAEPGVFRQDYVITTSSDAAPTLTSQLKGKGK